jgi:hypothetical protein
LAQEKAWSINNCVGETGRFDQSARRFPALNCHSFSQNYVAFLPELRSKGQAVFQKNAYSQKSDF